MVIEKYRKNRGRKKDIKSEDIRMIEDHKTLKNMFPELYTIDAIKIGVSSIKNFPFI